MSEDKGYVAAASAAVSAEFHGFVKAMNELDQARVDYLLDQIKETFQNPVPIIMAIATVALKVASSFVDWVGEKVGLVPEPAQSQPKDPAQSQSKDLEVKSNARMLIDTFGPKKK